MVEKRKGDLKMTAFDSILPNELENHSVPNNKSIDVSARSQPQRGRQHLNEDALSEVTPWTLMRSRREQTPKLRSSRVFASIAAGRGTR